LGKDRTGRSESIEDAPGFSDDAGICAKRSVWVNLLGQDKAGRQIKIELMDDWMNMRYGDVWDKRFDGWNVYVYQ